MEKKHRNFVIMGLVLALVIGVFISVVYTNIQNKKLASAMTRYVATVVNGVKGGEGTYAATATKSCAGKNPGQGCYYVAQKTNSDGKTEEKVISGRCEEVGGAFQCMTSDPVILGEGWPGTETGRTIIAGGSGIDSGALDPSNPSSATTYDLLMANGSLNNVNEQPVLDLMGNSPCYLTGYPKCSQGDCGSSGKCLPHQKNAASGLECKCFYRCQDLNDMNFGSCSQDGYCDNINDKCNTNDVGDCICKLDMGPKIPISSVVVTTTDVSTKRPHIAINCTQYILHDKTSICVYTKDYAYHEINIKYDGMIDHAEKLGELYCKFGCRSDCKCASDPSLFYKPNIIAD